MGGLLGRREAPRGIRVREVSDEIADCAGQHYLHPQHGEDWKPPPVRAQHQSQQPGDEVCLRPAGRGSFTPSNA